MLRRLFRKKKPAMPAPGPKPRHAAPENQFTRLVEDHHEQIIHVFCTGSSRGCYLGGKTFPSSAPRQLINTAVSLHEQHHREHGEQQHDNPFYSPT